MSCVTFTKTLTSLCLISVPICKIRRLKNRVSPRTCNYKIVSADITYVVCHQRDPEFGSLSGRVKYGEVESGQLPEIQEAQMQDIIRDSHLLRASPFMRMSILWLHHNEDR